MGAVVQVLLNLHYLPLNKVLIDDMEEMAVAEENDKGELNGKVFTPFQDFMREDRSIIKAKKKGAKDRTNKSKAGREKKKLKKQILDGLQGSKRPISLTKSTPVRKRLQPNL